MAKTPVAKAPARRGNTAAEPSPGFWDKPVLMNLISDFLIVLGGVALAWAAAAAFRQLPLFPLRRVEVANPVDQVTRGQIEHAARLALAGNFFTLDVDAARTAFEKLPWVRRAEVRRRWPDGVELTLEEHVAVARWQHGEGEARFVNTQGELFVAGSTAAAGLPALAGPEGTAALVLNQYREFTDALAPLGRQPAAVVLTPRQAWEIKLDDGVVVELGRDQSKHPLAERMARFVAHYPAARQKTGFTVGVVDMRYPNGFVLRPGRKS